MRKLEHRIASDTRGFQSEMATSRRNAAAAGANTHSISPHLPRFVRAQTGALRLEDRGWPRVLFSPCKRRSYGAQFFGESDVRKANSVDEQSSAGAS